MSTDEPQLPEGYRLRGEVEDERKAEARAAEEARKKAIDERPGRLRAASARIADAGLTPDLAMEVYDLRRPRMASTEARFPRRFEASSPSTIIPIVLVALKTRRVTSGGFGGSDTSEAAGRAELWSHL